ncbi:nephrocystin-3 isoform X2 [Gossypium australe]|uniref:Nephrocystin-3 isoform X2 n=1 Tax=Gossypium australe TaxID=47621 RepID=A0A5B6UDK7_9ROSI|nr:nephrocystin-3 isoform X2 [Gossypium australe]
MAAPIFLPSPTFTTYRTVSSALAYSILIFSLFGLKRRTLLESVFLAFKKCFRTIQASLNLNSRCWLRTQKPKLLLYMVPATPTPTVSSRQFMFKLYSAVNSLETHVSTHQDKVASGVSSQNGFHRSKTLFDKASDSSDGMSDFERQLQELFNEVKTLITMGNEKDAVDLLQANYEAVKEQMNDGSKGIEEAAILDVIALGYMAVGEFKSVRSLLDAISEVIDDLNNDEPLLDSILVHMGSMYSNLGEFEKSLPVNERATDILENRHGKNSVVLVTPLLGIAKVLSSTGKAAKAVDIYHRVIRILELNRGVETEDLVVPLFGLGSLLIKEGKVTGAENSFIRLVRIPFILFRLWVFCSFFTSYFSFFRILNIYTKLYGQNDGRVGLAMCSLAHAMCAKLWFIVPHFFTGNANEAIDLYKKALQIIKDSSYMPLDDSMMENMRIDLAELLHVVGRGREGRELLEECLLITEKRKGKDDPSLVTHYLNLAASYSQSKDFVTAERLLRTSLEIMKRADGPENPSITFPMLHLAVTLYHLKQDEEAEKIALEALHIRKKAFGKDSLPVGEALDCLVSIQSRLGKGEAELLEQLERVLKIQEREFGSESEEVMVTLNKVVFYLDKLGKKDEKFALQKKLSRLQMKYKQSVCY